MQPLYFNPLDNTGNFIGTNPLTPTDVAVKTSFYPYFNPSIYQSFTFYSFPLIYSTVVISGTSVVTATTILPVTFSLRFGTELQTVYGQAPGYDSIILGSSSFVDLMGSNVFTGLIDTTNSIIVYQNEQVNSYYSQSLSYQVNIANLTVALNSVSQGGADAMGEGPMTYTIFNWEWHTTQEGYAGTPSSVLVSQGVNVNGYLINVLGVAGITNSTVAVTQIQADITVQNNDLANSQTFMNNAVTTLQSQVSLAGQIIGTLSSIMQSIIGNI